MPRNCFLFRSWVFFYGTTWSIIDSGDVMGPKQRKAKNASPRKEYPTRSSRRKNAKVVQFDEAAAAAAADANLKETETDKTNANARRLSGVKDAFYLKSILRATRRLSQGQDLRLSSGGRRSSIFNGDVAARNRQFPEPSRLRPSLAHRPRIRFRDSQIKVWEISPLPDKPSGFVRMPISPPDEPEPLETNRNLEVDAKPAVTKATKGRPRKAAVRTKTISKRTALSTLVEDEPNVGADASNTATPVELEPNVGQLPAPGTSKAKKVAARTRTASKRTASSTLVEGDPDIGADVSNPATPATAVELEPNIGLLPAPRTSKSTKATARTKTVSKLSAPLTLAKEEPNVGADAANQATPATAMELEPDVGPLPAPGTSKTKKTAARKRTVSKRTAPSNLVEGDPDIGADAANSATPATAVELEPNVGQLPGASNVPAPVVGQLSGTNETTSLASLKRGPNVGHVPWTEIHRPHCAKEFVGNKYTVERMTSWLDSWKKRLQRPESVINQEQSTSKNGSKKSRARRGSDNEWSEDEDEVPNLAFVYGPTGVGKTCLVYALAEELAFKVIEVNCSSSRTQKQISSDLAGATQTHRINPLSIVPDKTVRSKSVSGPVAKAEPQGIQKYFAPATTTTKKRNGRKTPPVASNVDVITIDDEDETKPDENANNRVISNNNTKRDMSLILFDDVDVVFNSDDRFWAAVREIAESALIPIVMTCAEFDISRCLLGGLAMENFELNPISSELTSIYCRSLLVHRRIALDDCIQFVNHCQSFRGDLRACLNHLQFWIDGTSKASNTAKNRRRPKPPMIQQLDTATKDDQDGFDQLAYEMRWLRDQYSSSPTLKWPSRCLDGLDDQPPESDVPDTTKEKITAMIDEICDQPRFASPTLGDQNVQQISKFRQITSNICPTSSLATFHARSFALDYLPILRSIAATDKANASKQRRRGRAYLHKIGLDDRSGDLQEMLAKPIFDE